ncbi:MAG: S8 family serine peptidase [Candidatus Kerfeldbacteria bacterium]|nr:S8 family serine peptidase [Candidatus Kerfeldbacteria bacterium]
MKVQPTRLVRLGFNLLGLFALISLPLNASQAVVGAVTAASTTPDITPWQSAADRSIAGWGGDDEHFATDHILVKRVGLSVESVAVDTTVADALSYWKQQADVEYAEPDGVYQVLGQETSWGWSTVKASEAATTNSVTGSGIVVAVVDTGVDYVHEDLDANNWVNTGETASNNIDDDGNGYVDDYYGYDFIGSLYTAVTPDSDPQDEYGHGTHVSGIIAAENNTVGVRGVAPSAQIMPVKVLDSSGYGFDSTIADGIRYAVDEGADIINLSLGSSIGSNTIKEAIDYAATNNVLVVAASGNSGSFSSPSYPAAYSSVVSVGATDEDGYKTEWSNWGKVDVMAPGNDIVSSIPGNLYDSYSGTSMASPHVAGVAALIMQKFSTTDARTVRHLLETTADDFGPMTGVDYMSGYGMVNALDATTTPTAGSTYLFADQGYVITDASDDVIVTASVRTAGNAAVASETVTWSTTKGTVSAATSTTNANGEATITFTADDTSGLATITADPANYAANTIQLAFLDDTVHPESIGVTAYNTTEDTSGEEEIEIFADSDISANLFTAGDKLTIWAHPTGFDRETHDIEVSYTVTDPDGEAITGMTGTMPTTEAGYPIWIWYLPQTTVESNPLKIPNSAVAGEYTVSVTVTDLDSSETSTATTNFWVDELPEALIIDDDGYCYDTPIEGLDFGYVAYCISAGQTVATALDAAGHDSLVWNVARHGYPTAADLALFPLVIVVDGTFSYADTTVLSDYLDAGGNLLITSEMLAYNNTYGQPSDFLWNYLHVNFASNVSQPAVVNGFTGSDFAGVSYDINTYNLDGDGVQAMYLGDELQVDPNSNAVEPLFAYTRGETDDMVAGVRVSNSTYRAAYLTFGIESINDSGTATKAELLDTLADWLLGNAPTISKVTAKKLDNNRAQTITIRGTNFQLVGETTVKLRKLELSDVVVYSRTKITATVPAGLTPRSYSLKVIRPDGRKATKSKAVQVTTGEIFIDSLSTTIASNNSDRELTVSGGHFNAGVSVFFGTTEMTEVTRNGSSSLTVTIPEGFAPGNYKIKLTNPDGTKAKRSGFTVRVGFTETLAVGDTHDQVLALEKRLKNYGYFDADPDTDFDSITEEALVRYQTDNFLQITGTTDANTRYYLNNN